MRLSVYRRSFASKLTAYIVAFWSISGIVLGCWKKAAIERTQDAQIAYRPVLNPIGEMCTDDSESRTEYFNVPVVRFEGSGIQQMAQVHLLAIF